MGSLAHGFPAYYDIADHDWAQKEARQRMLPLAWVGGFPEDLNIGIPRVGSPADLEQMALFTLRDNAVIIFFDGRYMGPVPPIVHAQFHIHDDDSLPPNISWLVPKVVFTNPEVTRVLGRVSFTQMKRNRDAALNSALQLIRNNPTALALPETPSATPSEPVQAKNDALMNSFSAGSTLLNFWDHYGLYLALGALLLLGALFWIGSRSRT